MLFYLEGPSFLHHNYKAKIAHIVASSYVLLKKKLRASVLFHLIFAGVVFCELFFFFSFFAFIGASNVLAFLLALFFLTLFSYCAIRLYFQTKKPELLMSVCEHYLQHCKQLLYYREGNVDHHIALAHSAAEFASHLQEKEYSFYPAPPLFNSLTSLFQSFSAWCHWKEVHRMRELLLYASIEEYVKVVKKSPTDLNIHAALANVYVLLSSLYKKPVETTDEEGEKRWIPKERYSKSMQEKFRRTSERAIEEFTILNDYAPHDPWIHRQLAESYNALQMPIREIQQYELLLKLSPSDSEVLFKLGSLYFAQGLNAKGLRAYEILKQIHEERAKQLITFYSTYEFETLFSE